MKEKQETKQFPQTPVIKHALNFKDHPQLLMCPQPKSAKGTQWALLMFSEHKKAVLAVTTFHTLAFK